MIGRREFLATAILAPATLAQAAQQRAAVTFGFSLYGMRDLELDRALETCARLGYDAVELACMPGYHAEPRRLSADERTKLRGRLRELRLSLPALMENLPLDDDKTRQGHLDRLRGAAELGHDLSPDAHPLIETILGGKPGQWDMARMRFADRLAEWARVGEKTRTVIAVKPHRSNALNLPEHATWLIEQVKSPWVRLAYDFSHFQHRNLTLANTLQTLLPLTRFIHVKDVRMMKDRFQFLLPGDGDIDYPAYFKQLQAAGFQGCVCVEVSGMVSGQKGYDAVAVARRCHENLSPAFRQAGLRPQ